MQKKRIYRIIEKFAGHPMPLEIQRRFQCWLTEDNRIEEKDKSLAQIWEETNDDPDYNTIEALNEIHQRIHKEKPGRLQITFRKLSRIAAMILVPLLSVGLTYFFTHKTLLENSQLIECFTENGEHRQLTLPDGSVVWLNAGSLVIYPTKFTGDTRTVFLIGEANFSVAKDKRKPFIVKTNYLDIEALGTVFNVRAYPELSKTTATLEEGKIRVDTKLNETHSYLLLPDEQIEYDHQTDKIIRKRVDSKKTAMWKEGYLIFQGATLEEIMNGIERKYNVVANIDVSKYRNRSFTIRFAPEDNLKDAMDILKELITGFNYEIKDGEVYIR